MKNLISHIEFLILEHEYVIIPDFGGFVLNKESARIDGKGNIFPPTLNLGFNSELKYNDGLLAQSYMQRFSIPYDIACRQIEATVKRIKSLLNTKQPVDFGRLGKLNLANGRILFEPSGRNFMNHPSIWGYSAVDMRPLTEVSALNEDMSKRRKTIIKYVASIAGTAAAAAIILFSPLPFFNSGLFQTSGFLPDNTQEAGKMFEEKEMLPVKNNFYINDSLHQRLMRNALLNDENNEDDMRLQTKPEGVPRIVVSGY